MMNIINIVIIISSSAPSFIIQNQHAKCRYEHKGDGEEGDDLGEDARVRLFHQVPQASLVSGIKLTGVSTVQLQINEQQQTHRAQGPSPKYSSTSTTSATREFFFTC